MLKNNVAFLLEQDTDEKFFSLLFHEREKFDPAFIPIVWSKESLAGKTVENFSLTRHCFGAHAPESANTFPDYYSDLSCLYVSDKLKNLLIRSCLHKDPKEVYEFFSPIFVGETEKLIEKKYSVLWIKDGISCLDAVRSTYKKSGKLLVPAVRHDAVDGLMHVFRIQESRTKLCVSRQLAEVLSDSKLTGFKLTRIEMTV